MRISPPAVCALFRRTGGKRSHAPERLEIDFSAEDFTVHGMACSKCCKHESFWTNVKIDEEEKYLDFPSMTVGRENRVLWLAYSIVIFGSYDTRFVVINATDFDDT